MCDSKERLRHCALYEHQKGNSALQAVKNLCDVFGETAQRWFEQFRNGDFSLKEYISKSGTHILMMMFRAQNKQNFDIH